MLGSHGQHITYGELPLWTLSVSGAKRTLYFVKGPHVSAPIIHLWSPNDMIVYAYVNGQYQLAVE